MKSGEPIGKWFIEVISAPESFRLKIMFNQLGLSYTDGINTYYLVGDEADKYTVFDYVLHILPTQV